MAFIRFREDRQFIDNSGRMFWINGPETFCYISEQRQWRTGLTFAEVLEWKQCAPSGLVSQRFGSIEDAIDAFEDDLVVWHQDLYLRKMGSQMALHRGAEDYRPTAMKLAEAMGAKAKFAPWMRGKRGAALFMRRGPRCLWPGPAGATFNNSFPVKVELAHPHRRRRLVKEKVR